MSTETPLLLEPSVTLGSTGLEGGQNAYRTEWHSQLVGSRGARVYAEMKDNCAIAGTCLKMIKFLLAGASFTLQAGPGDTSGEVRDLVLSELNKLQPSWASFMMDALSMLEHGWAWFEVLYKEGPLGWTPYAFAPRPQISIAEWRFDSQGLVTAMVQQGPKGRQIIPMVKSLHLSLGGKAWNPEGQSYLRQAYRSYLFKKRLEEIEAMTAERRGTGLPVFEVPPEILNPNASDDVKAIKAQYDAMLKRLRRGEVDGILIPSGKSPTGKESGYAFRFESPGSTPVDFNTIIQRYEVRIAFAMLSQFAVLGLMGEGSHALAATHLKVFRTVMSGILDVIEQALNQNLFPTWMGLRTIPATHWPQIRFAAFTEASLLELATALSKLVHAGVVRADPELEKWVRTRSGMPEADTENRYPPPNSVAMQPLEIAEP